MQDLTLVGLTEDKSNLVLVSDAGEEYTLPVDAKLRAALRGDYAPTGQWEMKMESALRPRDIQARIRAGESPHAVAEAAQTTVDRIMSYATPVLAERAHIAERAQRASIRRRGGEGQSRVLGDAVTEQMRSQNIDPDSVDWDAWRREDGRWMLVADFRAEERNRRAAFVFDVQGRYVVAEDDDARWLVGEQVARGPVPQPASDVPGVRRLSAVSADEELPLGDDAIELVTGPGEEVPPSAEERTVDLTKTARELRGGTPTRPDGLAPTGDADWMATQASDRLRPPRRIDVAREPEQPEQPGWPERSDRPEQSEQPGQSREASSGTTGSSTSAVPSEAERGAASQQAQQPEEQQGRQPEEQAEPAAETPEPAPKKTGRKGRRASVPSWDEIMFGGGRSD